MISDQIALHSVQLPLFIKLTDWLNKELLIIHNYLEKDCWKKSVRQSRKVIIMSYDQYTFPDTVAVEPITFAAFI